MRQLLREKSAAGSSISPPPSIGSAASTPPTRSTGDHRPERQKLVRRALGADAVFMTLESRSPDEIFACGGYGAKGSVGFLPARVSLSHCFHSGVW